MNICLKCKNETKNPKFCSKSCSASYNNLIPKRQRSKKCKIHDCNNYILSNRSYCKECLKTKFLNDYSNITLKDIIDDTGFKTNRYRRIRDNAKHTYDKSNKPKLCTNCFYDKHYEVCHIKSISSFDKNTTLNEINNINNLIALCPNCHWEFDKGLLKF